MKKFYYFVLTLLTVAMLALMLTLKIPALKDAIGITGEEWYVTFITSYAPMILLCLFAFGSIIGKTLKTIFVIIVVILLIGYAIVSFFPQILPTGLNLLIS